MQGNAETKFQTNKGKYALERHGFTESRNAARCDMRIQPTMRGDEQFIQDKDKETKKDGLAWYYEHKIWLVKRTLTHKPIPSR